MWFDKERPNHIHRCARARFYYTVDRCVEGPIHRIDGRARALIGPLANYAYIDQSPAAWRWTLGVFLYSADSLDASQFRCGSSPVFDALHEGGTKQLAIRRMQCVSFCW